MSEAKQVNQGYTIIESMIVGNARFVIGENLNSQLAPYVTWQANVKMIRITFSGDTTAPRSWERSKTLASGSVRKRNSYRSGQLHERHG